MKERRNGSNDVSTLQIALSTGLISISAIVLAAAVPTNTEKAPPPDLYGLQRAVGADSAPTATPSCPPVITQSTSQAITTPAPLCAHPPPMFILYDNFYWRAFNMQSFVGGAEFTVSSVSFGVFQDGTGGTTVIVRLYANNGAPFPAETGTLIGTSTLTVTPGQGGTIVTTPLAAIVPAGTIELVIQLQATPGGGPLLVGANTAPETGLSYWSSIDKAQACSSTPQVIASHLVFDVNGTCTGHTPTPTPSPCGTTGPGDAGGGQTGAPDLVSMSGNVSYCSNPVSAPVPGVTILINNFPDATTDSSGHYSLVRKDGCYYCRVRPTQADRTPGSPGISTVDVVAVQRHFLIIGPPLSGCRLTAGDVNGDASINTIDVVAIQRFFLGLSTGIANVGKYQFNPSSRCFGHASNQNFDTLIFGDVATPFIY
jgi:hypothetical protein